MQIAHEIVNNGDVKPCAGEEKRATVTAGQPEHSPLSRGLREFTESRRPLPPRRGRACCSSLAAF